jgi:hypothetical protein
MKLMYVRCYFIFEDENSSGDQFLQLSATDGVHLFNVFKVCKIAMLSF